MAYKFDDDLEFLRSLKSEDLNDLVSILTIDKDGEKRFSENLTTNDLYKYFYPDHQKYINLILEEIQCFGESSIANLFRGGGVKYKEVLCDACDKMKVNFNKNSSVELIEQNLLMKILQDSLTEMNQEQLKELVQDLDLKTTDFTSTAVMAALQIGIKQSGFLVYKIAVIVANAVAKAILGRGLSLALNAGLVRTISVFAGPIGWAITGAWAVVDIAGPAYRVTIPTVIQIAFLRQLCKNRLNNFNGNTDFKL